MAQKRNPNKIFVIGFVLVVAVIVWSLVRPLVLKLKNTDANSESQINAEILKAPSITADNLFGKISNKENVFILDIRSTGDFEKGHIIASFNIVGSDINVQKMATLGAEKTSSVVLLNQGSDVFETAKKTNELVAAGFPNTKYLQGGLDNWKQQGFSLISGGGMQADESKVKTISIDQIVADLTVGVDTVQFLDVRSKVEYGKEHVIGAVNVPFAELEKNKEKISAVKKVVIYGSNDTEAKNSAVTLFDLNFFNAYVWEGGLDGWKKEGGKTESGN